jgi:hypothetical protein
MGAIGAPQSKSTWTGEVQMTRVLRLVALMLVCACSGGGSDGPPPPPPLDPEINGQWSGVLSGPCDSTASTGPNCNFVGSLGGTNAAIEGFILDGNDVVWRVTGSGATSSVNLSFTQPSWFPFTLSGSYSSAPGGDQSIASAITGKLYGSDFNGDAVNAFRTGPRLSGGTPTIGYNSVFSLQWRNKAGGTAAWSPWVTGQVTSGSQSGSTYSGRVRVTDDLYFYTGSFTGTVAPSGFTSVQIMMDAGQDWGWNSMITFDTGFIDPSASLLYGYGLDSGDEIRAIAEW